VMYPKIQDEADPDITSHIDLKHKTLQYTGH